MTNTNFANEEDYVLTDDYDLHQYHSLKQKKMKYMRKGLSGLVNLGNKCYMNSILQCLSNTLKLTDYFLCGDYTTDIFENNLNSKNEMQFVSSYHNLIDNIWQSNKLIKPKTFTETLGKFVKKFNNFHQQDSHECLLYILDFLHNGLSYEIDIEIQGEIKNAADKLMKESLENWKTHYEKNFSIVSEIFHGLYYNKVACKNCDFVENVFEPYCTLNLDIPNEGTSLVECINKTFTADEFIESWQCDKCNKNGCVKNNKIWNLPNYLIIHLKRFDNHGRKLNTPIQFDLKDINLSNIISSAKCDPNNYIYSLYAVNYHSGSLNAGHYWSTCKNMNGEWHIFNDGHVSKFNDVSNLLTKDAYILFYYRKYINKS